MKRTRLLVSLLLAVLLLAVSVAPAMAASAYTGKRGTSYSITETLYLENSDAFLEDNDSITYTLAFTDGDEPLPVPESGNGTINTNMYSGHPTITTSTVAFTSSTAVQGVGTDDYSRYMTGNFVIDFSGVTFYEPGIYRYNLTKTMTLVSDDSHGTAILPNDVTNRRANDYILLYVASDDNTATLKDVEYVHANSNEQIHATPIGKTFRDRLKTHHTDLAVSKVVSGSMGSKSQYFKFTLTLSSGVTTSVDKEGNPVDGSAFPTYKVTGSFEETTQVNAHNSESKNNYSLLGISTSNSQNDEGETVTTRYITLDKDGNWTGTVWLKHGQGIMIDDLPAGTSYTVSENPEDYTCDKESNSVSGKIPNVDGSDEDSLVSQVFTNTKETPEVPTGINLQLAAPLFGMLLAGILLAVVLFGKRRENL